MNSYEAVSEAAKEVLAQEYHQGVREDDNPLLELISAVSAQAFAEGDSPLDEHDACRWARLTYRPKALAEFMKEYVEREGVSRPEIPAAEWVAD